MKKILFSIILVLSTTLLAVQPTIYNCTISFMNINFTINHAIDSDGSTIMEPTIVMNDITYDANKITVNSTMMGTIYTIRMGYIPDLRSNYVSFIMPSVNVMPGQGPVEFRATMYNHYKRTSIGGSGLVHGVIDNIGNATNMMCTTPAVDAVP